MFQILPKWQNVKNSGRAVVDAIILLLEEI